MLILNSAIESTGEDLPSANRLLKLLPAVLSELLCVPSSLSQNHRIVGVGRDLCGSSSPTLLPKQGHLILNFFFHLTACSFHPDIYLFIFTNAIKASNKYLAWKGDLTACSECH